jgi:acyl carrier protein
VIVDELRRILVEVTGREAMLALDDDASLLHGGAALDSLTGTLLLREVRRRYGVDVAEEDVNLDSLATLGTLAEFIRGRVAEGAGRP